MRNSAARLATQLAESVATQRPTWPLSGPGSHSATCTMKTYKNAHPRARHREPKHVKMQLFAFLQLWPKNIVKHEDFETRLCMHFYEEKCTEDPKTSMKYVVFDDAETTVKHDDFARRFYPHFYEGI